MVWLALICELFAGSALIAFTSFADSCRCWLQHLQLKCCGKDQYTDWYEIDWSTKGKVNEVPQSCCIEKEGCDATREDEIHTDVRSLLFIQYK